jgi:hypothetical protein
MIHAQEFQLAQLMQSKFWIRFETIASVFNWEVGFATDSKSVNYEKFSYFYIFGVKLKFFRFGSGTEVVYDFQFKTIIDPDTVMRR